MSSYPGREVHRADVAMKLALYYWAVEVLGNGREEDIGTLSPDRFKPLLPILREAFPQEYRDYVDSRPHAGDLLRQRLQKMLTTSRETEHPDNWPPRVRLNADMRLAELGWMWQKEVKLNPELLPFPDLIQQGSFFQGDHCELEVEYQEPEIRAIWTFHRKPSSSGISIPEWAIRGIKECQLYFREVQIWNQRDGGSPRAVTLHVVTHTVMNGKRPERTISMVGDWSGPFRLERDWWCEQCR